MKRCAKAKQQDAESGAYGALVAAGTGMVNADGAISKLGGKGGGGVVIRDHDGAYRGGACHFLPAISDSETSEILVSR